MSASDQMRLMLDQLMGTNRDGTSKPLLKFTNPKVCRSHLLACCPHDILANTRMDLGECPRVHDLALRADFDAASKTKDYFFDVDAYEHLDRFLSDCDAKTEIAKLKLAESQQELTAEVSEQVNKIHDLGEKIGQKLAKAEEMGSSGEVESSMQLMEEVETIRKAKQVVELEYRNMMPSSTYQQQKLRVCEVCSAYLGIHDNDRRLADHFGGKLHLGFIEIRDKFDELKENIEKRRELRREAMRRDRSRLCSYSEGAHDDNNRHSSSSDYHRRYKNDFSHSYEDDHHGHSSHRQHSRHSRGQPCDESQETGRTSRHRPQAGDHTHYRDRSQESTHSSRRSSQRHSADSERHSSGSSSHNGGRYKKHRH